MGTSVEQMARLAELISKKSNRLAPPAGHNRRSGDKQIAIQGSPSALGPFRSLSDQKHEGYPVAQKFLSAGSGDFPVARFLAAMP